MKLNLFLQSVIIMYLSNEQCMSLAGHISKEPSKEGTVHDYGRPEWRAMDTGSPPTVYLI